MEFGNSKSPSIQDDLEIPKRAPIKRGSFFKFTSIISGKQMPESALKNTEAGRRGKPFKERKLSRVFSEDYDTVTRKILRSPWT